jgi:uncharacterized phage-associated protein
MASWFQVRKAAQIAAFFAHRQGGNINLLKLVKLIYLANRASMEKFDHPMFHDYMVSMDHGPVDSALLNYINGTARENIEDWEEFITARANYNVGLRKKIKTKDLDELSDSEIAILEGLWEKFSKHDQWDMVKYTHRYCAEWENPRGTSKEIPYERVFKTLGKKHSDELALAVERRRQIDMNLSGR